MSGWPGAGRGAGRPARPRQPGSRGTGLSELAVDERQHLAPVLIQTRADQPRGGGKALLFEMTQQRMHCWCPRPGGADHHAAPAVDYRPAAAGKTDQIIGRGHGPLSGLPRPRAQRFSPYEARNALLPILLPNRQTTTDRQGRSWNIGPAHGPQWTVLDELPTTTDQMVAVNDPQVEVVVDWDHRVRA
jgi:hypothetical protein